MSINLADPTLLKTGAYVDGNWLSTGATMPVTNPSNGQVIADVAKSGAVETKQAIDAAESALTPWQKKTAKERANLLRRWFDLLIAHQDDLAEILTAEQGKVLAEARGEIIYGASYIEWFAE